MSLAYAVVHDDPPAVYAAENIDVLQWVIALQVVARTPASALEPETARQLRDALLDERWGEAVALWIERSGVVIDVYPDGLEAWTAETLRADMAGVQLQFTPLFSD